VLFLFQAVPKKVKPVDPGDIRLNSPFSDISRFNCVTPAIIEAKGVWFKPPGINPGYIHFGEGGTFVNDRKK